MSLSRTHYSFLFVFVQTVETGSGIRRLYSDGCAKLWRIDSVVWKNAIKPTFLMPSVVFVFVTEFDSFARPAVFFFGY
jgi:hypothetical protein